MSDSEGSGDENDEQETELWFTCKKCPGQKFRTVREKDAHRDYHRDLRNKNSRPGPASKRRSQRAVSPPTSVAGTLFSVRHAPRATTSKNKPTDTSAKARKERAVMKHIKQTPVHKKKFPGA